MPSYIPEIKKDEIESFAVKEYPEIACSVLKYFLKEDIDGHDLYKICRDAYNFPVPAEKIFGQCYILRLDRGPTASFKDFAARMMARLIQYYINAENRHITILTATSGDTGSAVANAFHGLRNIDVIILFPCGEITLTQRKQMTTLGDNIRVIALDGKFDDCQHFVKKAFLDDSLSGLVLTSANSINIGRLLPQAVYYFYTWAKLAAGTDNKIIFSVPSGNFGNLMGGIIAREMGLPVKRFIIASNLNNEVPEYLRTGIYHSITPSVNCISSAMNVGHPGNLARIIDLYGGTMNESGTIIKEPDMTKMRRDFFGVSVSDESTRVTIEECFIKHGFLLEPHGAVAWKGLELFMDQYRSDKQNDDLFVSLETAHPSKFRDDIMQILGFVPSLPETIAETEGRPEYFTEIDNNYNKLKDFILMH